jgi:iron complex outermembrane receptor protein
MGGVAANSAMAQETRQTAASAMLEEVIITARKKEESMQDVPVAVSALNSEQLEALKIRTIDGVWRGMPNVNMQENGTIKG